MKQAPESPPGFLKMSLAAGGAAALGMGMSAPAIGQATKTHALRPHAAGRPDPSQGDRDVRRRGRQAVGQQDQGRDLPELAARHHLRRCCSRCRPAR